MNKHSGELWWPNSILECSDITFDNFSKSPSETLSKPHHCSYSYFYLSHWGFEQRLIIVWEIRITGLEMEMLEIPNPDFLVLRGQAGKSKVKGERLLTSYSLVRWWGLYPALAASSALQKGRGAARQNQQEKLY